MFSAIARITMCLAVLMLAACTAQPAAAPPAPISPSNTGQSQPPRVEEIAFQSGPFGIVGDLRLPGGAGPFPVVLIVHGDGSADRTAFGNYLPIFERILRAGYAVFSWDKPGSGESTGTIDRSRLIEQRAQIVLDAVSVMKARADIDPRQIGLAGISQGGYVMPRAVTLSKDIAFMIAISGPAMSGYDQTSYLIMSQALCAGVPAEKAPEKDRLLKELDKARTYTTYAGYLRYRQAVDALIELAATPGWSQSLPMVPERDWQSEALGVNGNWDPTTVIEHFRIPVLAFFGGKDTQLDPIRDARVYREALARAGNPLSRVVFYPDAAHGMVLLPTGCIEELTEMAQSGTLTVAPGFLDTIEEWLGGLTQE